MGSSMPTLSSLPDFVWIAGQPLDAVLHLQGPPGSRPLPGLRPAVNCSRREPSFHFKSAAILTCQMWQALKDKVASIPHGLNKAKTNRCLSRRSVRAETCERGKLQRLRTAVGITPANPCSLDNIELDALQDICKRKTLVTN